MAHPPPKFSILTLALFAFFILSNAAFAQGGPQNQPDGEAACGACCGGVVLVIAGAIALVVLYFMLNIAILFWVAKDAKSRGMDGAMWIFLILFTGLIGLAIYLFSRPQGNLIQCASCGNFRMQASRVCPHCSNT